MNRRSQLIAAVLVIALAVGAYWWYSPILVIHQMQEAAAQADADGVNEHVDYPALRESLRAQYSQAMARKIGQPGDNPLSALGTMIGMAFINQMIDAMARPETIAAALTTGRMKPAASAGSTPGPAEPQRKVLWQTERKGTGRVIAHPHEKDQPVADDAPAFVFVRHDFADWKLSEVRLHLDDR